MRPGQITSVSHIKKLLNMTIDNPRDVSSPYFCRKFQNLQKLKYITDKVRHNCKKRKELPCQKSNKGLKRKDHTKSQNILNSKRDARW